MSCCAITWPGGPSWAAPLRSTSNRGELVPDQVVLGMVREAMIAAKAAGGGFVLDGIPRNMEQARAAYEIGRDLGMAADVALHLQADDAELTRRLLARATLEHRSDDTAEVIAQRLALYHEVTSPSCRGTATAESWSRWTRCGPRRRSGVRS